MTLADFAAAHLDLGNNWARANDPANAADPNVAFILSFGTLENYLRASADAYQVAITATAAAGGGGTTGTGGTMGGGISPLFDPVQRLVAYTRQGYEVYQLIDEAGRVVEWYDIPGRGALGQHYLASRVDPQSYVYSTQRPATTGGGGGGGLPGTLSTGGSGFFGANAGTLLLIAGGLLAIYLSKKNQ